MVKKIRILITIFFLVPGLAFSQPNDFFTRLTILYYPNAILTEDLTQIEAGHYYLSNRFLQETIPLFLFAHLMLQQFTTTFTVVIRDNEIDLWGLSIRNSFVRTTCRLDILPQDGNVRLYINRVIRNNRNLYVFRAVADSGRECTGVLDTTPRRNI